MENEKITSIYELEYLVIQKFIWKDDRLTTIELKLLAFINTYSGDKFYFSNDRLAEMFNTSEKTIQRAIANLKEYGYISCSYAVKNTGGKIRFINKVINKVINNVDNPVDNSVKEEAERTKMSVQNGQSCPFVYIKDNKIKDNTPPTPQKQEKGGEVVNKQEKVENCDLSQQKGEVATSLPEQEKNQNLGHFRPPETKNNVNWEHSRTPVQQLIAFWIKIDNEALYRTATKEQIRGLYGQLAKYCKIILDISGDIEIAKKAMEECRNWLISKKLNYNIATITRNINKFINMIKSDEILPPEVDIDLWNEYCYLRELKKGKFDKKEVINKIKQYVSLKYNINKILENKIVELKRYNKNITEEFKNEVEKVKTLNKENNFNK